MGAMLKLNARQLGRRLLNCLTICQKPGTQPLKARWLQWSVLWSKYDTQFGWLFQCQHWGTFPTSCTSPIAYATTLPLVCVLIVNFHRWTLVVCYFHPDGVRVTLYGWCSSTKSFAKTVNLLSADSGVKLICPYGYDQKVNDVWEKPTRKTLMSSNSQHHCAEVWRTVAVWCNKACITWNHQWLFHLKCHSGVIPKKTESCP